MRTFVIDSTVLTAQTGPPIEYAVLNMTRDTSAVEPPSGRGQDGRLTSVSRGMLTIVAFVRPASRWTTIAVSDRAPSLLPPPSDLLRLPLRESDPRTRMFSASLGSGVAAADGSAEGSDRVFAGRLSPSALSMSTL